MAPCRAMICHQVTLSGDAEWPKVADAVIEAHLTLALGRQMLASESVRDLKVLPIPAQFRGVSQRMLPTLRCCAAVDPLDGSAQSGVVSER